MKKLNQFIVIAFVLYAMVSCKKEEKTTDTTNVKTESSAVAATQRIVSLNGAVTEVIAALGHEKEIVGRDVTSTYPESVKASAKDLGHVARGVSVEAIMALQPTLILGTEKDMTPELQAKIKASGIKSVIFKQEFSVDGAKRLIADVAAALGHKGDIKPIQDKIDTDLTDLVKFKKAPKVLFIYARGANMLMVSGTGTPIESIIQLSGSENAVTDFADFKPLTPEALIKGNPDAILLFDSGAESVKGIDGVLKIPGVDKTNAGKNKNIITMDGGLLTNFGPRTGEAAKALNQLLAKNAK
ncbi:hemin ABC transporter substrate-binding protein [Flavobacterium album]|uniref:Hemin ABC transporter substrate-binding protein n=1 Tax=Flavobacterium album TaxID=2175091 RepID=A0A2S1QVG2_9FLAO|nr:ABC transporter substrate-binding protein [Flavobacterium album]AWH84375.1 hemin ABC transporter substrate-binding protein [Flavobacterium album]